MVSSSAPDSLAAPRLFGSPPALWQPPRPCRRRLSVLAGPVFRFGGPCFADAARRDVGRGRSRPRQGTPHANECPFSERSFGSFVRGSSSFVGYSCHASGGGSGVSNGPNPSLSLARPPAEPAHGNGQPSQSEKRERTAHQALLSHLFCLGNAICVVNSCHVVDVVSASRSDPLSQQVFPVLPILQRRGVVARGEWSSARSTAAGSGRALIIGGPGQAGRSARAASLQHRVVPCGEFEDEKAVVVARLDDHFGRLGSKNRQRRVLWCDQL